MRSPKDLLQDILERTESLARMVEEFDRESFSENEYVYLATLRNIEIIGEAVKNLPEEFKEKYPEIPWRQIGRVRDILAHVYFAVSSDRIWEMASKHAPELEVAVRKLLNDMGK